MPVAKRGEQGQGLVEYALILVLVAVVVIVMLALAGPSIGGALGSMFAGKPIPQPTDVCPGTTPIVRQLDLDNWGKRNVMIDYTDINGDEVHLLWFQKSPSTAPELYQRDVDAGDNCKQ